MLRRCANTPIVATVIRRYVRSYHGPASRDIRFSFFDVHDMETHYASLQHKAPCDRETVEMVLDATAALCQNELAPIADNADSEGCTWIDTHTVKTPRGFKEAYAAYAEAGWQSLS